MSGIGEALAVVACVAALITAYKDGDGIVQQLKEKRRRRNALPLTRHLEESLQESQIEIDSRTKAGLDRFGDAFGKGDDVAVRALQEVTIAVQASLLRNLHDAVKDDNMTDFTPCIDSAIEARLKAINILNDLYLRQQKCATGQETAGIPVSGMLQAGQDQSLHERSRGTHSNGATPNSSDRPARKSRMFSFSWKRERRSPGIHVEEDRISQWRGSARRASGNAEDLMTVVHNRSDQHPFQLSTSVPPLDTSRAALPSAGDDSSSAQPSFTNSVSRRLTLSSTRSVPLAGYRGFCKGAYYLQASLDKDGLKVGSESVAMTGANHFLHCKISRCAFQGRPGRYDQREWQYDNTIYKRDCLQYRWLFLAKSHVEQGRIKKGKGHFRCFFCSFEQGAQSPVVEGSLALIDHVSRHHGEECAGVPLYGPLCIHNDGIVVASAEVFDICFPEQASASLLDLQSSSSIVSPTSFSDGRSSYDRNSVFDGWMEHT